MPEDEYIRTGKSVATIFRTSADDASTVVEAECSRHWWPSSLRYGYHSSVSFGKILMSVFLAVSQFTLLASTKKAKPDFHRSAAGDKAKELYKSFFSKVQELYMPEKVEDGVFQAMMDVGLVNDGPVGVEYNCEDGVVMQNCPATVV